MDLHNIIIYNLFFRADIQIIYFLSLKTIITIDLYANLHVLGNGDATLADRDF